VEIDDICSTHEWKQDKVLEGTFREKRPLGRIILKWSFYIE
jgi:hypothetical protein